jgi:hypothetical protein
MRKPSVASISFVVLLICINKMAFAMPESPDEEFQSDIFGPKLPTFDSCDIHLDATPPSVKGTLPVTISFVMTYRFHETEAIEYNDLKILGASGKAFLNGQQIATVEEHWTENPGFLNQNFRRTDRHTLNGQSFSMTSKPGLNELKLDWTSDKYYYLFHRWCNVQFIPNRNLNYLGATTCKVKYSGELFCTQKDIMTSVSSWNFFDDKSVTLNWDRNSVPKRQGFIVSFVEEQYLESYQRTSQSHRAFVYKMLTAGGIGVMLLVSVVVGLWRLTRKPSGTACNDFQPQ